MEEEDEIQAEQSCKFPRVGNEEENGRVGNLSRFNSSWHHNSSRIIRVSRASGGKDRHSKVMTSKGLRDRRVRLSVTTAIQFYDLQDRLGYDQPSKAVEWLIKSASDAISELPSLNNSLFRDETANDTNNNPSDSVHDAEMVVENGENNYHQQSQNLSLSKSGCSSTSETSKGSGLSLSRSDVRVSRVKARERARERTAKEKEKESHESHSNVNQHHQHRNVNNSISQTASFTELLTGGINNAAAARSPRRSVEEPNFFNKVRQQQHHQQPQQHQHQWSSSAAMDHYFSPVLLGTPSSSRTHHIHPLGHSLHDHQSMTMSNSVSPFSSGENHAADQNQHQHHQMQQHQFSFIPDHMMQNVVTSSSTQPSGNNNDYNLNFTISSGLAGYNRGTLQSNSPSLLSHLQRFSVSSLDGSNNLPFFMGGASTSSSPASGSPAPTTMENNHNHNHHHHHQFSSVFDGSSLQLYSDQKGKPKN